MLCQGLPEVTQVDGRVGYLEEGLFLDIAEHRPDISAVLKQAADKAADVAPGFEVGVVVAGTARCIHRKPNDVHTGVANDVTVVLFPGLYT